MTGAVESVITWDGFAAIRLVMAGAAIFIICSRLSTQDLKHLVRTVWLAFVPIVMIMVVVVLQIAPLPIFTNPVWDSARSALGAPLSGHISVDLPSSVAVFMSLSADIATFVLSACFAIDRFRAIWLLLAILGTVLFDNCFQLLAKSAVEVPAQDTSPVGAAMGVVIAVAGVLFFAEKSGTRGLNRIVITGLATLCVISFTSSVALIVRAHDEAVLIATCYGLASMGAVYAIRRSAHTWLIGSAVVIGVFTGVVVISELILSRQNDGVLAFVEAPKPVVEQTRRMIDDSPLLGTGAGTFSIVNGLYRGITDKPLLEVPSAAAAWTVELGAVMFYSLVIMAIASHIFLLWDSLQRGRDFAYPAMGGGLIGLFVICVFVNAAATDTNLGIVLSAALGLSFGQRLGRRVGSSSATMVYPPANARPHTR